MGWQSILGTILGSGGGGGGGSRSVSAGGGQTSSDESQSATSDLVTKMFPGLFGDPATQGEIEILITYLGQLEAQLAGKIANGAPQSEIDTVKQYIQDVKTGISSRQTSQNLTSKGASIGNTLLGLASEGFQSPVYTGAATPGEVAALDLEGASPYSAALKEALLNPKFGASNPAEQAMIDSLMASVQGKSALKGLGPTTAADASKAIAPTLLDLYQKNIQNLQGAKELDLSSYLTGRDQNVTQRGQNVDVRGQDVAMWGKTSDALSSAFGTKMQTLLDLAALSMPQVVAGQTSTSSGSGSSSGWNTRVSI